MWTPNPGPQTEAFNCLADELYYGGGGGGGKTSLICGLALAGHYQSIIFRPTFPELREVQSQLRQYLGERGSVNANGARFGQRTIELGYMHHEDDKEKYRGRPHDFIGIDEAALFSKTQVQFVTTWLRSTRPNQRCRVVLTGNPPSNPEGRWVIDEYAPWLDSEYPDLAKPGELRWYVRDPGPPEKLIWMKSPEPVTDARSGKSIRPLSRTFIPALLSDNPFLGDDYFARMNAQPEPLRSQMLYGDHHAGTDDNEWQVIPTAWARAAMRRWKSDGHNNQPMDAIGLDVARGGKDQTALAPKHGRWFAPLQVYPGTSTPDGPAVARLVMAVIYDKPQFMESGNSRHRGFVRVDVIGVGAAPFDVLKGYGVRCEGINFAEGTDEMDRAKVLTFGNLRAAAYWQFRDALDPDRGDDIALPPDNALLADLCAARFKKSARGIMIESKEDITKRIGRSPDRADAVVYANYEPTRKRVSPFI